MLILKQSTSVDIRMGPFVDATTGVDPEVGVVLASADQAEVLKANGAATVAMAGTFAAVTGADGWYDYTCAAGDVDTIGEVVFVVQDSSVCLPVFTRAQVVEESVYDSLFASGSSDIADILVDTGTTLDTKINDIQGASFSSATDSLEALRDRGDSAWTGSPPTSDSGTAQAGSTTTITLAAGFPSTDNILNGQVIYLTGGTGAPASRAIDSYNGTTGVATIIGTWPGGISPDATTTYDIYPDSIDEITDPPTAAAVADAVWDENTAGHTSAGTFGEQLKNDVDAILVDTSTTLDTAISTMQGNVTDILADTNELQGDWANTGRLDTILDSIASDASAANTTLGAAGAGLTAIPWNAAWDAEVESECNDALVALNLDHLLAVGVGSADVIDNSVIAKMVSKGATADWDTFNNTQDSLEALFDQLLTTDNRGSDIQSRLPAALIGGRMDSDVEAINNVVIVGDGSTTPFNV